MTDKQSTLDEGKDAVFTAVPPGNFPGFRVYRNYMNKTGKKSIGLIIGKDDKRYFWKSVDPNRHFHRNHRAWAIASSLVEELHREKVDGIILHVRDDKDLYASLYDFSKYSIIDRFPPYEEQCFLHEYYWKPWNPGP